MGDPDTCLKKKYCIVFEKKKKCFARQNFGEKFDILSTLIDKTIHVGKVLWLIGQNVQYEKFSMLLSDVDTMVHQ